jgi:hypothetical protein
MLTAFAAHPSAEHRVVALAPRAGASWRSARGSLARDLALRSRPNDAQAQGAQSTENHDGIEVECIAPI